MVPGCGANLTLDSRSFERKLVSALDHPLPETRARICWLVGKNHVEDAVEKLMELAQSDPDMFIQRAAVEALGHLSSPAVKEFLRSLVGQENPWLRKPSRTAFASCSVIGEQGTYTSHVLAAMESALNCLLN